MSERLEHELDQLNGKTVCVVRPGYGNQSDSWVGILTSERTVYPIHFLFSLPGFSMRFVVTDVVKVDSLATASMDTLGYRAVVRLKGPEDYNSRLQYTVS